MKKSEIEWDRVFPEESESFSSRIERTLASLEEGKEMKKIVRPLLVIAALVVILAGTALAVAHSGSLMDFFSEMSGLAPEKDARESVSENLGTAQLRDAVLTVRSAVYDGRCVRMLAAVEAVDPEHVILVEENQLGNDFMNGTDGETVEEYAVRTGKRMVNVGWVDFTLENADLTSGVGMTAREGETLLVYLEGALSGEQPETARVYAYMMGDFNAATETGEGLEEMEQVETAVTFDLPRVQNSETRYMIEQAEEARFRVLDAVREDTPFATYFTLVYSTAEDNEDRLASLYQEDAVYYGTPFGTYIHTDSECMGMRDAQIIPARDAIAQGKAPCPVCASQDAAVVAQASWNWELLGGVDGGFSIFCTGSRILVSDSRLIYAGTDGQEADVRGGDMDIEKYGVGAKFVTVVLQAGAFPQGELTLTAVSPEGARQEPVVMRVPR